MNRPSRPTRLFTHVLLRVVPAAALVLTAVWFGSTRGVRDTVEAQIHRSLKGEAERSAASVGRNITLMTEAVRSLADNDLFANALIDTIARHDYLVPFFRSLKLPGPRGGTATFTDYRGRVIAATGPSPSYRGSAALRQVMKGRTYVRVSAAGLIIAAPVRHLGRPEGMVIARYDARQLGRLIRLAAPGTTIAATDRRGRVIYSSNRNFTRAGAVYPPQGPEGWLAATVPIREAPGIFLVSADSLETAMAPARQVEPYLAVKLLLGLVTLVAGIAVTALLISRPVEKFIKNLRQIRSDGDLSHRVVPGGPKELRALAREFNKLLTHLEDTTSSHSYVASILNSMNEIMVVTDGERRIRMINIPAHQLFSDGEDTIGRRLDDLPLIATSATLLNFFVFFDESRETEKVSAPIRTSQGQSLIVSWSRARLTDAGEMGFVFVGRDVTAQRAAEAALFDSEQRLHAVFDTVIDGIITIRADGTVTNFNPAAGRIFGYRADEVLGKNISMLMPEAVAIQHGGYLEKAGRGETRILGDGRELMGLHRDGSVIPVEITVTPMEAGGEPHFTGIVRDISERKKMELMKNEFVSVVSHELRTPLTSLLGSIGLIRNGAVGEMDSRIVPMVDIAQDNGERLLRLVNDILDIGKIEAAAMEYAEAPVELVDMIDHSIRELSGFAAKYDVTFTSKCCCDAIWAQGDRDRLIQALTNLLSNAAKFSPKGGVVTVGLDRQPDGTVRIAVSDQGPGIPKAFRDRIFGKFAQADASDTRRKDGTGLGLNISKAIVEHHGGEIGFDTEEGVGTEFYFTLAEIRPPVSDDLSAEGRTIPGKAAR